MDGILHAFVLACVLVCPATLPSTKFASLLAAQFCSTAVHAHVVWLLLIYRSHQQFSSYRDCQLVCSRIFFYKEHAGNGATTAAEGIVTDTMDYSKVQRLRVPASPICLFKLLKSML